MPGKLTLNSENGYFLSKLSKILYGRSKKLYELLFEFQKAIEFYCLVIKIHEHYNAKTCVFNIACLDKMSLLENKIIKD